jgi:hypothetical protein
MKVCTNCGIEIDTRDVDTMCQTCEDAEGNRKALTAKRRRENRKAMDDAMRSIGMTKVRGAMGGTYWE